MSRTAIYTVREEWANTLSHGLGIILGLVASFYLLARPMVESSIWAKGAVLTYLFGMLLSYGASTFYHGAVCLRKKEILQKIDHAAIYIHIAGTYTPFTLVTLRHEGLWGWGLFAFVWMAALIGTFASFREMETHSHLETICYVVMGCSVIVALKPLMSVLQSTDSMEVLYWLVGGGILYIIGAVFYSLVRIRYMHTIFHLFVLGGSICHILAIYKAL